jgi:alkylhydroperoxidase/carboxymuconolactone decarboxylase family protein YurZ
MTGTAPEEALTGIAQSDAPVIDTILAMHLDALERSGLDPQTYLLTRLAVLVALDAPPASYAVTLAGAADAGVTVEKAQSVLVAIAPLVGTPRVTAAAGSILRALIGMEAVVESARERQEE